LGLGRSISASRVRSLGSSDQEVRTTGPINSLPLSASTRMCASVAGGALVPTRTQSASSSGTVTKTRITSVIRTTNSGSPLPPVAGSTKSPRLMFRRVTMPLYGAFSVV